jgi:hypothetical protein
MSPFTRTLDTFFFGDSTNLEREPSNNSKAVTADTASQVGSEDGPEGSTGSSGAADKIEPSKALSRLGGIYDDWFQRPSPTVKRTVIMKTRGNGNNVTAGNGPSRGKSVQVEIAVEGNNQVIVHNNTSFSSSQRPDGGADGKNRTPYRTSSSDEEWEPLSGGWIEENSK